MHIRLQQVIAKVYHQPGQVHGGTAQRIEGNGQRGTIAALRETAPLLYLAARLPRPTAKIAVRELSPDADPESAQNRDSVSAAVEVGKTTACRSGAGSFFDADQGSRDRADSQDMAQASRSVPRATGQAPLRAARVNLGAVVSRGLSLCQD